MTDTREKLQPCPMCGAKDRFNDDGTRAAAPEAPAESANEMRAALSDALAFMKDVREQRGDSGLGVLIRNAEAALSNQKG